MRRYGWIPDLPDSRDYKYTLKMVPLPKAHDLRASCSPVEDQGILGSCTGNAAAGELERKDRIRDGKHREVSRLFIYYLGRERLGTVNEDSGATIRDVIKGIAKYGACDEELYPYVPKEFTRRPSGMAYDDARKRKIRSYYRIGFNRVRSIKEAIFTGNGVIFGFSVYDGFEMEVVKKTGKMWIPSPREKMIGGHAVLAVGYDDEAGHFIVRNSWGESWGDRGYFFMPYGYIENDDLSDDFWVIEDKQEFTANKINVGPEIEVKADWYFPITAIIKGGKWLWEKFSGRS